MTASNGLFGERSEICVLAGLDLGGATLTPLDDLPLGRGRIGTAVWGPGELLDDLELRLGLGANVVSEVLRVARWAERMARTAPLGRFYTRSVEVDALGTARTLLKLRDSLVLAGWDGGPVPDGGPRLEAVAELESLEVSPLPPGVADRVTAVARVLEGRPTRVYAELRLAEQSELWPARWQTVFGSLERAGTRVSPDDIALPGAPEGTDLARVQRALASADSTGDGVLNGDGSFLRLTAETSWEAARVSAAILGLLPADSAVVIRDNDVSALDNALSVHGLRAQGWHSRSPWRAALQVLPLALELAFEPKDPYRVLEILTLPVGPFQGLPGHRLARALSESPGIGSPAWERAKSEVAELRESSVVLERVGQWLEQPGAAPGTDAPKADLLAVIARVRDWMVSRIASTPDDPMPLAAARHASALSTALESDPRSTFSLIEVRRLAESALAAGASVRLTAEAAGRTDHVASAAGLRAPRETVLWWSFVDDGASRAACPWRPNELRALARVGVRFPDPRSLLAQRAQDARRAIHAATRRVILVTPRSSAGSSLATHPLWSEIVARLRVDDATLARVEIRAGALSTSPSARALLDSPPLDLLEPSPLPGGRAQWIVPDSGLGSIEHVSATGLDDLLGCPLRWVLRHRAQIRSGGHALPPLRNLNGTLGHRLIERLHEQGAFELVDVELERRAGAELDTLFRCEGAVLLRAGMSFERSQLRRQLVTAVLELQRVLHASGLRIVAVEKHFDAAWRNARLNGRIDLLVVAQNGVHAIVDVKWGHTAYRDLLAKGRAVQLAAYAFAHAAESGARVLPDAAYFSLSRAELLAPPSSSWPRAGTIDGPSLHDTWTRIERTVTRLEGELERGRIAVTGLKQSLPLLTALEIPEGEEVRHYAPEPHAACKYCQFDALCGRRWEVAT